MKKISSYKSNGLILNFSPNEKGSCKFVSAKIYESLSKRINITLIDVHKLKILPCKCKIDCSSTGQCSINNDDMKFLYSHFENDDILIFVSPVYFYHLPGYPKMIIDRCQPYWVQKYLLKNWKMKPKFAATVLIGATKGKRLFYGIDLTMKYFFDVINCKFDTQMNLYLRNIDSHNKILVYKKYIEDYVNKLETTLFP